jgi:hypothetical protein
VKAPKKYRNSIDPAHENSSDDADIKTKTSEVVETSEVFIKTSWPLWHERNRFCG